MKSQSGFTLIEMVAVIIILAIMAATAMPRFTNLTGEARMSSVAGMAAAMTGARNLAKSKWFATNSSVVSQVDMGGTLVNVQSSQFNGAGTFKPGAQGAPVIGVAFAGFTSGMWAALDNPTGFTSATNQTTSGLMLWPTGVANSASCYAYYNSAGDVGVVVSGNIAASCL